MTISWDDLSVKFDEKSSGRLLHDWMWLIGTDKTPILVSSIGDMFLSDGARKVYWLNSGDGTLTPVAATIEDFRTKLQDPEVVRDWFLVDLISALKENGHKLESAQVYSYKKLIVLGGDFSPDNFEPTDIEDIFHLLDRFTNK